MRLKKLFSKIKPDRDGYNPEELKTTNPKLWKKLKKQFDIGRKIVNLQMINGLDNNSENTLRYYLSEYVSRYLEYGPQVFPTSFNSLEPFFKFNFHNSIIELMDEEEAYSLSLLDFLNYITSDDFNLENIDYYDTIVEHLIYHFQFNSDYEEYNFSTVGDVSFFVGSLSMIRQGNEVSMLIECGKSYNKSEAEKDLDEQRDIDLADVMNKRKGTLGFSPDFNKEEIAIVNFNNIDGLWSYNVALLFDIESKSIDIRYVARDDGNKFKVLTDDFHAIFSDTTEISDDHLKVFKNHLDELSEYDSVFDFAKYCLSLPSYINENEEKIVEVMYETKLSNFLSPLLIKREYLDVPKKYKVYAKPLFYLESDSKAIIKNHKLDDNSFQLEKTGYWKRIGIDEQGFDKKGLPIIGKTWVERQEMFYTSPKVVTKVKEVEKHTGPNVGYIYIMRQAAHEENIFKVGLTRREVEKRSKELSNTSAIDKFHIITKYLTKDCVRAEKLIHEKLTHYRLSERREFFACDLETIMNVCSETIAMVNNEEQL